MVDIPMVDIPMVDITRKCYLFILGENKFFVMICHCYSKKVKFFTLSDPQTVARYTVQPGPPTQSWNQNLNENSRPSTPIKPSLSQQIPSRGSSLFRTSPASSGPHSPLHDQHPDPRQPESPQDTGSHSPIPLEYDRKGKRKARDSDSEGQNPEPATKKRKGDSTKARSFPASSSSNRNRRNDMGAAKRKRALKLEAAKSQSPKPEPTIDSILDRENLFCNRPPCVNKPVGGKGRKSNMDQHVNVNHPTHPDAKLPENKCVYLRHHLGLITDMVLSVQAPATNAFKFLRM